MKMEISKVSNSIIQKIDYIILRELPTNYLVITLSEGLSLEIGDENTIHIRSKKERDDKNEMGN